ncbi:MAG: hypothetical protein U0670_03400 [Anaerolineae bacterium]
MPVNGEWLDEARTIWQYNFIGRWTWEEFYAVSTRMHEEFRTLEHRIDMIANFEQSERIPAGAISEVSNITQTAPPNWGCAVVIGANMLIRSLVSVFGRVFSQWKDKYIVARDQEEALQRIRDLRARNAAP